MIFLENAALYGTKGEVSDDRDLLVPFGQSKVVREGSDVTVVAYSRMVQLALSVAEKLSVEEGVEVEVVDLRTIRPLDMGPVLESVRKTHRAVVLQEQWKPFGAAAEIAAGITEEVFDELDAPVMRVTGADVPMPYARNLELLAVPHEKEVIDGINSVLYRN